MLEQLRFDGRVVVVTGAGAGLGRTYALLFAERGACVVVNDLGGGRHGDGSSSMAADSVVGEIRMKGGKAVPDYNSVEDGEKIIETALENFGRIDVVVNNAGILRDKSFARISDADWDLIQKVHLKGTFKTTQAAWPHFKKQNYGRVIVTSSNSGLYGNFGQANYSAAKMAVVGLSNTLAIEGQRNNIHCNVIVPTAASRLTEDILPPEFFAELRPELIAPVVVWLCHESCGENGSIIESAAGWAGKYHLVRSQGSLLRSKITDQVAPEDVQRKWENVSDMTNAIHMESIQEASGSLMTALEDLKSPLQEYDQKCMDEKYCFTSRDLILYALGVGASVNNQGDLRYLYENHENFTALPTYFIIPGQMAIMGSSMFDSIIPGKEVDLSRLLHGEQFLERLHPLPSSGTVTSHCSIVDVLDKGSGAVIIINVDTYNEVGDKIAFQQMTAFAVGSGGFGGKRNSERAIPVADHPARKPDFSVQERTSEDQAALYRLSGDVNPIHIDPNMAAVGGFSKPILHGLCSLGFSARHILQYYASGDSQKFKAIKVRFAKPVIPGQTLKTDMWQEGARIHFETKVLETGDKVITGAYLDLVETPELKKNVVSASELTSQMVFDTIKIRLQANMEKYKKINGVFLYQITKNGKQVVSWTVDLKSGQMYEGDPKGVKPDCTLILDDQDMVDIATGKMNPQVAFMKGKLKVKGNIMLTQKLQSLMKEEAKL